MDLGANPFSFSGSNGLSKSGDGVPALFPAGLRVLVVDDDPTCLRILEKMLKNCLYEVRTCNRAEIALDFLRDDRNVYDVVISDVHMPDMDGFKLLEHVGLEMDLPVIMMSADDSKNVVMKGVTHGACDYLIKPVRMEALKNIWQHVVRRKKHEWKDNDFEQSASVGDQKAPEDMDYSSSASEGNWTNSKKRKDVEDESDERDDPSALKRPRVVWSVELHQQFVTAVNQLGIDKAVPKKILELMNVPGLTRENVASHLQKYRLYLRRLSGVSQHPNGHSFIGPPDFPFGSMPPLNAVDFQALAASGQIPPQSLAALQAAALGNRATADQRNIFSFENPKLRFLVGHHQPQNNIGNQFNLLHGIPTNMHTRPQNNPLLVPFVQPKNFNDVNSSVVSQPAMGRAGVDNVRGQSMEFPGSSFSLARNTGMSKPREEVNRSQCQPILPQAIPGHPIMAPVGADSVRGQNMDFPRSNFSLAGIPGIPGLALKLPEEVSGSQGQSVFIRTGIDRARGKSMDSSGSNFSLAGNAGMSRPREQVNGPPGFVHNYDVFSDLNQNRAQDWGLQNAEPSFEHSYVQRGLDVKSGQSRVSSVDREAFSEGLGNVPNVSQKVNLSLADNNPLKNKVERKTNMGFQNVVHSQDQFGQEDLMTAFLKEQPEGVGVGSSENEFNSLDGYHLDNLSVQHTT